MKVFVICNNNADWDTVNELVINAKTDKTAMRIASEYSAAWKIAHDNGSLQAIEKFTVDESKPGIIYEAYLNG